MKQLWKIESVNIKVTDHIGKIHWYNYTDLIENSIDLKYELEDLINNQGGTFDEDKAGKKDD